MCFVWISEQTAIISLYSINWLVFITGLLCVFLKWEPKVNDRGRQINQHPAPKDRPAAHIALRLRIAARFVFFCERLLSGGGGGSLPRQHISVTETVLCCSHRELMTPVCAANVRLSSYPVDTDFCLFVYLSKGGNDCGYPNCSLCSKNAVSLPSRLTEWSRGCWRRGLSACDGISRRSLPSAPDTTNFILLAFCHTFVHFWTEQLYFMFMVPCIIIYSMK